MLLHGYVLRDLSITYLNICILHYHKHSLLKKYIVVVDIVSIVVVDIGRYSLYSLYSSGRYR